MILRDGDSLKMPRFGCEKMGWSGDDCSEDGRHSFQGKGTVKRELDVEGMGVSLGQHESRKLPCFTTDTLRNIIGRLRVGIHVPFEAAMTRNMVKKKKK
jgi:hypothetical protein